MLEDENEKKPKKEPFDLDSSTAILTREMSKSDETTNPNNRIDTTVRDAETMRRNIKLACLVVIYGKDLGRRIPLERSRTVVGRSSQSDVQLDQESVSRQHCEFLHVDGHVQVKDLGSTNGTYVNDELISAHTLRDGDQVKIGRSIVKFIRSDNVENQYHEEIYRLMTTDGLTSLCNKRYFDEMLEREVSRAVRYGRTFSLIIFDVDHFKRINDSMGHLAGDAVLKQLGKAVGKHVRRDDIVARIGGEEFAIISPENARQNAVELASKLCELVSASPFEFESTEIHISISLGVAEWKPTFASANDIVAAADAKLYDAKRLGRNRVCS